MHNKYYIYIYIYIYIYLESHWGNTSNKYPDRALNSIQSIHYRHKKILVEETFSRPI